MGKVDYSSPLPIENLICRYKEAFYKLSKGVSSTIISIPYFGHTTHLRYISTNPKMLKNLGLINHKFIFIDRDRVTDKYESFASELLLVLSEKVDKEILLSQNPYLINKEIISEAKRLTDKKPLILAVVLEKGLTNYINEIENLFLLMQKSAGKFPVSILWIADTKVVRNYKQVHPSSTFLTNITYQKNFDGYETKYCLKRISNLKGIKVNKEILDKPIIYTGGLACTFHQFINTGYILDSDYVKNSLNEIKSEIAINKSLESKLITKEGLDFLNKLEISEVEFESVKLSKSPTAQEINILRLFQKNIEKPLTRDEIAQKLWGKSWSEKYSDWAIDKAISRLRKNIISPNFKIVTVKNLGYELIKL